MTAEFHMNCGDVIHWSVIGSTHELYDLDNHPWAFLMTEHGFWALPNTTKMALDHMSSSAFDLYKPRCIFFHTGESKEFKNGTVQATQAKEIDKQIKPQ